jgi:hypothetical protein
MQRPPRELIDAGESMRKAAEENERAKKELLSAKQALAEKHKEMRILKYEEKPTHEKQLEIFDALEKADNARVAWEIARKDLEIKGYMVAKAIASTDPF